MCFSACTFASALMVRSTAGEAVAGPPAARRSRRALQVMPHDVVHALDLVLGAREPARFDVPSAPRTNASGVLRLCASAGASR